MGFWLFILLGLCFCGILVSIFMITRNLWVFRQRMWWDKKAYRANLNYIYSGNSLEHFDMIKSYNALLSYEKMMNKFWCWDVHKMIADKDAYDFVMRWDDRG